MPETFGVFIMPYDHSNIFAKILKGTIPCTIVYEDDFALAFHDISPKAPLHVLIIPKGAYSTFDDFTTRATPDEISGFFRAAGTLAQTLNLKESGYRVISNSGLNGGQEVPHFHLHLLGGKNLGPMIQSM